MNYKAFDVEFKTVKSYILGYTFVFINVKNIMQDTILV